MTELHRAEPAAGDLLSAEPFRGPSAIEATGRLLTHLMRGVSGQRSGRALLNAAA